MISRHDERLKIKSYLPFDVENLTEETIARAEKELGETEDSKAKAIPELRKLIQKEPKLVCPTDDAYLLQYLRPRKFNVKKAFSLHQNYYHVKKSNGDLYDTLEFDKLMATFRTRGISVLPYRDDDGCAVLLFHLECWDTDVFSTQDVWTGLTISILFCVQNATSQINGIRLIVDAKGISLKHIRCMTPRYVILLSKALRNCMPVRFRSIHVVNESFVFQYFWRLLKLFLSEKIKNRFHMHGDNHKALQKYIPKAILPSEFGGDYTQYKTNDWFINEVERQFDFFYTLTTYGYKD